MQVANPFNYLLSMPVYVEIPPEPTDPSFNQLVQSYLQSPQEGHLTLFSALCA